MCCCETLDIILIKAGGSFLKTTGRGFRAFPNFPKHNVVNTAWKVGEQEDETALQGSWREGDVAGLRNTLSYLGENRCVRNVVTKTGVSETSLPKQACQKRRYQNRSVRNVVTKTGVSETSLPDPRRTANCRYTPHALLTLKSCYISWLSFKNSRQTDLRQLQDRQVKGKCEGLLKKRAAADFSLTECDWPWLKDLLDRDWSVVTDSDTCVLSVRRSEAHWAPSVHDVCMMLIETFRTVKRFIATAIAVAEKLCQLHDLPPWSSQPVGSWTLKWRKALCVCVCVCVCICIFRTTAQN